MPESPPEILILGGGVAGWSAAIAARRSGRSVSVISRDRPNAADGWIDWLHADVEALLDQLGVKITKAVRGRTTRLVFHAPDLQKQAVCDDVALTLVDGAALRAALRAAGLAAGVTHAGGQAATQVQFEEDRVRVRTDHGEQAGRMLIFADGAATLAASHVRLRDAESRAPALHESAQVTIDKPRKLAASFDPAALHLSLAPAASPAFGYAAQADKRLVIGLVEAAGPRGIAARLSDFAGRLAQAWGFSPPPEANEPARILRRAVPRGAALDCDTHVGKNCLVIGDAGGFVSAMSQDGVYPAVRSAVLAAATMNAALDARHPQDVLAGFDAAWRGDLAEFIRMPGVDIKMMLPMVFTNKTIAARMAQAFAFGRKSDRVAEETSE